MAWQVVDAEHADDWIANQLVHTKQKFGSRNWPGNFLGGVLPAGYARYIKIFHTILEDLSVPNREITWDEWDRALPRPAPTSEEQGRIDRLLDECTLARSSPIEDFPARRVTWSDLCKRYGLKFHPELTCSSFSRKFRKGSWPRYLAGPEEGSLTEIELGALFRCFVEAGDDEEVFLYWGLSRELRGQEPYCVRGHPLEGNIPRPGDLKATPDYIWPASRKWIVHSNYDLTFTVVAAHEALAEQLVESTDLETISIPFHMRIDSWSDVVNK